MKASKYDHEIRLNVFQCEHYIKYILQIESFFTLLHLTDMTFC